MSCSCTERGLHCVRTRRTRFRSRRTPERRFLRSQLGAEREVVTILALCSLGRANEAQRRAAALASRSPALTGLEGSCAERR